MSPQVVFIVATTVLPCADARSGWPVTVLAPGTAGGVVQPARIVGVTVGVAEAVASPVGSDVAVAAGSGVAGVSVRLVRKLARKMNPPTTTRTPTTARMACLSRTDCALLSASFFSRFSQRRRSRARSCSLVNSTLQVVGRSQSRPASA